MHKAVANTFPRREDMHLLKDKVTASRLTVIGISINRMVIVNKIRKLNFKLKRRNKMSDKIDKAWASLKKWAGACASNATVEDLKAALEKGENAIWAAQIRGIFNGKPNAGEKLGKVREGLGKIKETLEKVQDVCVDI